MQPTGALALATIDHQTGQVLAHVLADHQDQAVVELKALLEPFGVQTFWAV